MPSIFDFSGAIPWLTQGFLLGLLAYWLYRRLFGGGGAHHAGQIAELNAQLDAANRKIAAFNQNIDGQVTKANYYEGEYNTLLAANQALTQNAGDAPRLRAELDKLRADSVAVAAAVEDAYKKQINGLAAELNAKSGEAARLTADLSSTRSELDKLRAGSIAAAASIEKTYKDQMSGLQSQLNATGAASNGEVQRLTGELTKQRADSAAALGAMEKDYKEKVHVLHQQLEAAGHNNSNVSQLQNDLTAAKADLEAWRKRDLEWRGYEERYTNDITRLTTDLKAAHNAGGETTYLKAEVTRLTSELSNAKPGLSKDLQTAVEEGNRHKSEAALYAKALADAQASHQALAMEHHTAKNDLNQVRSGLEETSLMVAQRHREIEELKAKLASMPADIENYKRFKDALDAANRIASGQS